MRPSVLYTHELEPITIIDIPEWAWPRLKRGETLRLTLPIKFSFHPVDDGAVSNTVDITGEMIRRNGVDAMMLFTRDEEGALALKASFLAGQQRELRERAARLAGSIRWME